MTLATTELFWITQLSSTSGESVLMPPPVASIEEFCPCAGDTVLFWKIESEIEGVLLPIRIPELTDRSMMQCASSQPAWAELKNNPCHPPFVELKRIGAVTVPMALSVPATSKT